MGQAALATKDQRDVQWVMTCLARMFRPVVRFAVGRVSCRAVENMVREIYVKEARRRLERENPSRRVTYSSMSLLCGIDGRAIQAAEEQSGREYTASDVCSEAAILEMWRRDEAFLDPKTGKPADLLIHGPQKTFRRLVNRAAGRMVTAQTALERLLDSGNVKLVDDDTRVRMLDYRYMPISDSAQAAIGAGSLAISRLGKSILHNTSRPREHTPAWPQQDRWSMSIPAGRVEEVRQKMRELLEENIADVEQCLEGEEVQSEGHDMCSVGVGWYYWEECPQG